jgi:hypothetical protein
MITKLIQDNFNKITEEEIIRSLSEKNEEIYITRKFLTDSLGNVNETKFLEYQNDTHTLSISFGTGIESLLKSFIVLFKMYNHYDHSRFVLSFYWDDTSIKCCTYHNARYTVLEFDSMHDQMELMYKLEENPEFIKEKLVEYLSENYFKSTLI